jgi:hypothetical protein
VTYLGESATASSAIAAVGASALAVRTVAAIVANRRRRDNRRHDDQLRHQDRLDLDFEARLRSDQIEREDDDARKVLTEIRPWTPQNLSPAYAAQQLWEIRISAPVAYSVDRLTLKLACVRPDSVVVVQDVDHDIVRPPRVVGEQALWIYRSAIPDDFYVAFSFVNERNTLYFSYLGRTMRFPAGSDVLAAVQEIYNDISGLQSHSEPAVRTVATTAP